MQFDLLEPGVNNILGASTYAEFRANLATSNCSKCPALCAERHNIVVDRGNPEAQIMIIGEAPGENEDLQGKAFVGRAGQLLDKILASVEIDSNQHTLIANVVKCRPPENRAPVPLEAANCYPFLDWQLNQVRPRVVLLLGATAAKHILPPSKEGMKGRVGQFFDIAKYPFAKFMLLYHPAYLLRDPRKKPETWEHVKGLRDYLVREKIKPFALK